MKKVILLALICLVSMQGYSQISFEKGYFITNENQKTDCLIKNMDWEKTPSDFDYKLSEEGEVKKADFSTIKEFGIYDVSKYIRETVSMDRSSDNLDKLSEEKRPIFTEEQLFLKVLIEGKANLYAYEEGELTRYFYSMDGSTIGQLVYKKYNKSDRQIAVNDQFKQQLLTDLECPTMSRSRFEKLNYNKNSLTSLFLDYNQCVSSDVTSYEKKQKKDLFNLTVRPRLNYSSLKIDNAVSTSQDVDFDGELSFGFGVEAEFILPFNKNKWSFIVEPTYQYYKSEKQIGSQEVPGAYTAVADYSSIELPLGIRHYFFLAEGSKIFINASYLVDFETNSGIEYQGTSGPARTTPLNIATGNSIAFGLGYKFKDRYSLEFRYMTARDVLQDYIYWDSDYTTFSVILGYSLF